MGDTYLEPASTGKDLFRSFLTMLDRPAYWLLGIVYELFFNVASADLFSNDTIMKFYGRVQVILGVFMMFQLAMTILKGIVNPDTFTDSKGGAGNLITRVATSLILITLLMPISIPNAQNEYQKQVNNNGLLFGTLYSLQHRILSNNTLGRLVLGTNDSTPTFSASKDGDDTELKKLARIFTSTIIKGFYRINLVPEEDRNKAYLSSGKDPATYNENRVCQDIDDEVLAAYTRVDADPGEIISLVNATCDSDLNPGFLNSAWTGVQKLTGTTKYVFTYNPIISLIVPIVFIFILLSFTVDVAVRAVKLAVLRLIAPIPLISYMDPKGGKDSSFNSWVKTLTSTYLDLFIRLAVVYFVIFLIQDMIVNGISIDLDARGGAIGVLSLIIIWIGLFIFAKQAPKFIKQVLGLKDDAGGKLFGGFGEIAAGLGMAAAIPGAIGSGIASAKASKLADETRQSFGQNVDPKSTLNRGKHLLAGIAGGFAGGAAGVKAAATAKDHGFRASIEAMSKRNAADLARGNSGSTLLGRWGSTASNVFTGEGAAGALDREISSLKSKKAAFEAIKSRVSGEMVKKNDIFGHLGAQVRDSSGNMIDSGANLFNYKDFMARYEAAKATNQSEFEIVDQNNRSYTIGLAEAERQKGFLLKNNENAYYEKAISTSGYDVELEDIIKDATAKGAIVVPKIDSEIKDSAGNVVGHFNDYRGGYTTHGSEKLGQDIRDRERKNVIGKANDSYSNSKK